MRAIIHDIDGDGSTLALSPIPGEPGALTVTAVTPDGDYVSVSVCVDDLANAMRLIGGMEL